MTLVVVPSALIVAAASGLILDIFGANYAAHAHSLLVLLSLGSIAVAFNSWASCALRVLVRMRALVVSNVVLTVTVLGLAAAFGSRGLLWIGYAWVIGNLLSGLAAAVRIPPRAFSLRAGAALAAAGASAVADPDAGTGAPASDRRERAVPADFMELPTEPLFFPWNRPEAISFGARPPARRHPEFPDSAPPADAAAAPELGLHLSGMKVRPRAAAPAEFFAGEKAPEPVRGRRADDPAEPAP